MKTVATKAKEIRQKLKSELDLTSKDVSVTSKSYSMGSSIDIKVKSAKAVKLIDKIKSFADSKKNVRRCEASGEILSGGNTYISTEICWQFEREMHSLILPMLESAKAEAEKQGKDYFELKELGFYVSIGDEWKCHARDTSLNINDIEASFTAYSWDQGLTQWVNKRLMKNGKHPAFQSIKESPKPQKLEADSVELYRHSRTGADLWTVRLANRLTREEFKHALESAKASGGTYSKAYKPAGFPGGFTFDSEEAAKDWLDNSPKTSLNIDNSKEEAQKPKISPTQKEKLESMAAKLESQADQKLADRTENTPKQQRQASFARCEGMQMERAAKILRACAENERICSKKDALEAARKKIESGTGYYSCGYESDTWASETPLSKELREIAGFEGERFKEAQAAQFLENEKKRRLSEIKNSNIEGFFPTPGSVINMMLDLCGDLEGASVFDPSAGIGSILEAAKAKGANVSGLEINWTLADYCKFQGFAVGRGDFMELEPKAFDYVLMNPPFERKQAAIHTQRALDFVKDGGRLVAVAPSVLKNGQNYEFFRAWLAKYEHEWLNVQSGAFNASDSFRKTGVETKIIAIYK